MKKDVFVILFSFLVLIFFFNRGFAYYDEGFILHAAQRVLQGEIPYRDFDLIYTPGTVFLTVASFKIFGESVLAGRILMLLVNLLTGYLVYLICYRATKNNFVSFLALLIYLAWGPTHINFPWPSTFALTAGLATLWALPSYFLAGILTAVVFLVKQNFGIAMILTVFIQLSLMNQMRHIIKFLAGFLAGLLLFITYLQLTGSFQGFLNNFYFYTVKGFLLEGIASTVFPSGIKGIFYLLPALVSLTAIFLVRKKSSLIILPLFTLLFYFFGIRPTTDYPHLAVLMAMIGIPIAIILENKTTILDALRKSSLTRMTSFWLVQNLFNTVIYGLAFLLVFFGFYTALFKNYYRWDSPLHKQKYFVEDARTKIFVDQKFNMVIPKIVSEIKKNTAKNEYIFIFPNAPMFYFLTDRKNPTRYINLPQYLYTIDQEREVLEDLKKKRVQVILTNEPPNNSNYPAISEYILKNYLKKEEFLEFTLWEKAVNGKHFEVLNI